MSDNSYTRRQFVRTGGLASMLAIAGCSGEDESVTDPDPPDVEEQTEVESVEPVETNQTPTINKEQLTPDGYPRITLNWANYFKNALPSLSEESLLVATAEDAPQRALDLGVVSMVSGAGYYEEYQTAYAAKERLRVDVGDTLETYHVDTLEVTEKIEVDGYPNTVLILESNLDLFALTRAGGLIAGGSIDKDNYMDPKQTLIDQLRTGEQPEGGGMAQNPWDILPLFDEQYGHESLDLSTNNAASTPMDGFSKEQAKELVLEWYDESKYDDDDFQYRETRLDDYPIDSHEAYDVIVNVPEENLSATVTSWVDSEYATRHAQKVISQTRWTFHPAFLNEDYKESSLGPYDSSNNGVEYPNCGLVTEDGVHKLRKQTEAPSQERPITYDVFSGNITIVR